MSAQVSWGVLGYARIARLNVIPAIGRASNARLYAIATRHADKASGIEAETGCARVHASYEALLADAEIQAVYIPLPNALHREWAIAALRAGKHVLCEKPIALNLAQAREMFVMARAEDRLLMEAFMYRYTERTRQVREVLASGVLGTIRHVNASFRFFLDRPNNIRVNVELGGGALYDVGCYPVNLLGLITGRKPVACHAQAEFQNGVDVNLSALMRYDDGLIATIHCGFNAFGRMGAEIIGTQGVLEIPDPFLDFRGEIRVITQDGTHCIPVAESDRYCAEIEDFSSAIMEGRSPLVSAEETLRNMEVLDMLYASLERH